MNYTLTPSTEIRLLKCPLESDNRHQLTFANLQAQTNYFLSLPYLEVDDATYLRKEGVIHFPKNVDTLLPYNYVMYKNENFSDKWFYAFIVEQEYENSNMTNLYIETDVFQTWQFDITWKKSFIEREHVSNDTIGLHTVPENLETGEYYCYSEQDLDSYDTITNNGVVIATTVNFTMTGLNEGVPIIEVGNNSEGMLIANVPQGMSFYYLPMGQARYTLQAIIRAFDNAGKGDSIQMLYNCPSYYIADLESSEYPNYVSKIESNGLPVSYSSNLGSIPQTLGSYTPINKKVLTYPFNYLLLTNNNGGNAILHYEKFNGNVSFNRKYVTAPGNYSYCYPLNYNGISENYNEGLVGSKFPIGSWNNDVYINWLVQNQFNRDVTIGMGQANIMIGGAQLIASGGIFGYEKALSGLNDILKTIGEQKQHEFIPPQSNGNTNGGDVLYSAHRNVFTVKQMGLKQEYVKMIDNYFSLYGYKVNEIKVPNLNSRLNWNFIKTIGANIIGDIPEEHLNKIKTIFNTGITLWHNTNTFLDYSQNNGII